MEDLDFDNIFIDKKSHKNILNYHISYKNLINSKTLRIRFDKIDGFTGIYDRSRCLTLFHSEKYEAIYNRIRYPRRLKICITYIFSHYFANIKVDYNASLPLKKYYFRIML